MDLMILTCVFLYINTRINKIDLEIRILFVCSCFISYILTIIPIYITLSAFRIIFGASKHPGIQFLIQFFLLCTISILSFLFFLRILGAYFYRINKINLGQYEKFFTEKKFKPYEDTFIQVNNFQMYSLSQKGKEELKYILIIYNKWYSDRYDKFAELRNAYRHNSGECNFPVYFDYANDLFIFFKLYFKKNRYTDLNNKIDKEHSHVFIDLDKIQIRKDQHSLHGYLYLVNRQNKKLIAVLDPWRGLFWPNNKLKTKQIN